MSVVALNPLDLVLYATDEAQRLEGLPGADIHIYLECTGHVELARLRRAVACVQRAYPGTAARLERSVVHRRPRWRLPPPGGDVDDVVELREVMGGADEVLGHCERVLNTRCDWSRCAPLRFAVLRGRDDDVVIMRWPHFLMDARAGVALIEQLQQFYEGGVEPDAVASAGDELRHDFGRLEVPATFAAQLELLRSGPSAPPPPSGPVVALSKPTSAHGAALRIAVRRLDAEAAADVRRRAMQTCGFGRFADYVRAAGLRALYETVQAGGPVAADATYTTLHLVDNRRRRDPGPVCHNVFSMIPVHVPAAIAGDIAATADLIYEQAGRALADDWHRRRLAGLALLGRVPTRWLVGRLRRGLRRAAGGRRPRGIIRPPSLPLGFMGALSRPMPSFCGAGLKNMLGVRVPNPVGGFALSVNITHDRMNLAMTYYESHLSGEMAATLLDGYVAALLE